ncbi:hypothetical protein B0H17DRAFT_1337325 [Mycena rosella]|uniref:F-box domain-containing protein n=1 Tax=Mycena rosella TaxID=1033263 RepID=A0AAD7CRV8_MYCRO|nr:hypothetical protein B0H17DRAFT_1337325 [Mycena rosella]
MPTPDVIARAPLNARTETMEYPNPQPKPSHLHKLNEDCLGEAFSRLHPRDLLSLSRASRLLRRMLMNNVSRHVWRASLNTVEGVPECPKDFAEPRFSALAFESGCEQCSKKCKACRIDWDLRVRLCPRCAAKLVTKFQEGKPPVVVLGETSIRMTNVIGTRPPWVGCAYLTTELAKATTLLENLDASSRSQFVAERKATISAATIHARECRAWEAMVASQQAAEDAAIRVVREMLIRAKLFSLGWGDELVLMGPESALSRHSLVTQPEVLTDKAWSVIAPKLESFMQKVRESARKESERRLLQERKPLRFLPNVFCPKPPSSPFFALTSPRQVIACRLPFLVDHEHSTPPVMICTTPLPNPPVVPQAAVYRKGERVASAGATSSLPAILHGKLGG